MRTARLLIFFQSHGSNQACLDSDAGHLYKSSARCSAKPPVLLQPDQVIGDFGNRPILFGYNVHQYSATFDELDGLNRSAAEVLSLSESSSRFHTTCWTLVWRAAAQEDPQSRPALEQLLQRYWMPLYAYARQRGVTCEDAEDATQEFLTRVASGDLLLQADPARGKFRTYLLTAWRGFLIDMYRRQNAQRRGGMTRFESLDWASGESKWQSQQTQLSAANQEPDRAFMIAWAHGLLDACRESLRAEYQQRNKVEFYDVLVPYLTQHIEADSYAAASAKLGVSVSALKVALHRLRQRFASRLRELVAETVESPEDVETELGELLSLISS